MKEKELRIALVCYGGVSLAVYMHGVTKELWKLAKASQAYHAIRQPAARPLASFHDVTAVDRVAGRMPDTEPVYFELLQAIGDDVALRCIVDVVAGSSAGGINGVMLARGLAHDLPLDPLTDMWLEKADVTHLLAPQRRARRFSKWFLRPFLWLLLWRVKMLAPDRETRSKLSLFIRSQWFQPPFDGQKLMDMLLDAGHAMGMAGPRDSSLLPEGLPLNLTVTVTDYHGYRQRIPAHDPPVIEEREHRHVFGFSYRRGVDGAVETDFDDASIPGLVFAARASSSFPGAFPPVRLRDLDQLLAERREPWLGRDRFVARNFRAYRDTPAHPEGACFIDGSVLNNKPFEQAIQSIAGRPAYREVDRRIVYVDPNPEPPPDLSNRTPPGFFRVIKGALSDIPRNEPVRDELSAIARTNARVARLKGVLDAARPRVAAMVLDITDGELPEAPTAAQVRAWRVAAGTRAAQAAGFAYEAYVRLKIDGVLDRLAQLIGEVAGLSPDGVAAQLLRAGLDGWAARRGVRPERIDPAEREADLPAWVLFLRDFDIGFRLRRLRFVMRELNDLYTRASVSPGTELRPGDLDEFKGMLTRMIDELSRAGDGHGLTAEDRVGVCDLLGPLALLPTPEVLDDVLRLLARRLELETHSREADEVFALMGLNYLGASARRDLFVAYLGFGFWDVLTFSSSGWEELDEFHAMKVDRIGPPDASLLRRAGAPLTLRGAKLSTFGAFFSRADREHDYLLGRLHAAERLIDMVADAAGTFALTPDRVDRIKLRAFKAILASEEERLGTGCEAVSVCRRWLAAAEAACTARASLRDTLPRAAE